jgi:glutamate racemase
VKRKSIEKFVFFFDSGQGGLTLWESVKRFFPGLNTIYLGDNARYPYGNKSAECIHRYAEEALAFAESKGAVLFIVACGTASSIVVSVLSQKSKVPIFGVVDQFAQLSAQIATKIEAEFPGFGTSCVLGTRFTVTNGRLGNLIRSQSGKEVWERACPLFVPLVEEGIVEGQIVDHVCDLYLNDLPEHASVVLLACTHFPRLVNAISEYLVKKFKRDIYLENASGRVLLQRTPSSSKHPPIVLLDSSPTAVDFLKDFLEKNSETNLFNGLSKFYCTDDPSKFSKVSENFVNMSEFAFEKVEIG